MGIGSWLSKFIDGNLLKWFIRIELMVGLVGGLSAPTLFVLFEYAASFRLMLYTFVGLTGILVGLEIPLLMRILENRLAFKDLVSQVFTFDYIGALLASLIFPLVLVPYLGLIRTSIFFGLLNVGIAAILLYQFAETKPFRRLFMLGISLSALVLGARIRFCRTHYGLYRRAIVSGYCHLCQKHSLPADCSHAQSSGTAALPQREPSI